MPDGLTDSKQAHATLALRDRIGGGVLVLIGVYVVAASLEYRLGTLARMGPGMLPMALGVLLVLFGILIALFVEPEPDEALPAFQWRPLVTILAAVLAFALLAEPAGLIPATAALVFVSGAADPKHTLKGLSCLFLALTVFVWLVFVQAIGIPFQLISGVL
jgi:hypothetical protein